MASRPKPTSLEPSGLVLTAKLWNRLRHGSRLVRDEVTGPVPPMMRPLAWEAFKHMPLAQAACALLALLDPPQPRVGLYPRCSRRLDGHGHFDDIPSPVLRDKAEKAYTRLCSRHSARLPSCPWLLPILAGRARDLALRPHAHGSDRARQMRRIKGGKHVQRRYRELGWHPLASVRKAWGLTERPQDTH